MEGPVKLATVEEAVEALRAGRMIIVVDDEDRENEGDLVMAAEKVTPEAVNFMLREARGLLCVPLPRAWARRLDLKPMVEPPEDSHETAFTVSVDARWGVTTGISAADRARTILVLADPDSGPEDLARPGHVFPLIAREGGVLRRAGHTEAAVDLCTLAGLQPVGVICEIMNEDGTMARLPELSRFAEKHGLPILTIADLIAYRKKREKLVERVCSAELPTKSGQFKIITFRDLITGQEHLALVKGEVAGEEPVLVRVHSECLTGDALGSLRCDCGDQLRAALERIEREGKGVLLYMRQEGRGIGLLGKLCAYQLQDQGLDTVEANLHLGYPADLREYGIGAQMLVDLGVKRLRLLTNNPRKVAGLSGYGLTIVETVPIEVEPNPYNLRYLKAKKEKLGHRLDKV
ncbi:MAG: bifunctional 3,4-dihydroxy-2-butanone-4-phosphate synthase/GTP cyclohydrolase II [Candidatus Bipolaricaulota bacterium]|nr:bifunctional 3,4-dihydroxy-2-butanone-4-phosphate synthase/GTP cyclohydrolase II [Candidatus Bipolaricaulota bacterium]